MDKIFLRQLEVDAVIGIWEWERRIKQTVTIDLEMATDARDAAIGDDISTTLNYRDVAKRVIAFVAESEFQLVEALADAVAGVIIREFDVPWLKLSVGKPGAISGARTVGIVIERMADDYGD